jgi:hypothetical protein
LAALCFNSFFRHVHCSHSDILEYLKTPQFT